MMILISALVVGCFGAAGPGAAAGAAAAGAPVQHLHHLIARLGFRTPTLSNEEMGFARFGVMFHLTRGAANEFDPALALRGSHAGKYSDHNFRKINACDEMTALLKLGHGMVHNYLDRGHPAFLKDGATMTEDVFAETYQNVFNLYTPILEIAREIRKQPYCGKYWIPVVEHWQKFTAALKHHGESSFPGAGKKRKYGLNVDENTVKFARLAVICALTRKVTDYYNNDLSPLDGFFNCLQRDLRTKVQRLGQTIAHLKSQKPGLELDEYSFLFVSLEDALTKMENDPAHKAAGPKFVPYAAKGFIQTPMKEALNLIDRIKTNAGNAYTNLQPCCATLRIFKACDGTCRHGAPHDRRHLPFRFDFEKGRVNRS